MNEQPVSLVEFGSYLPDEVKTPEFFFGEKGDPRARSTMLAAPRTRRHVAPDERAAEMIEKAARPMFDRLGIDPGERGAIDILITNVLLPDIPVTGSGAEAAHLLGCRPDWIIDLHNGGCGSFIYMVKLAESLLRANTARTALICNVQNSAGQIWAQSQIRKDPHAAVPGDGCGVAYLVADDTSPVLAVETVHAPEFARDMGMTLDRKYWEAGPGEGTICFGGSNFRRSVEYGRRIVPEVVTDVCKQIGKSPEEIDVLVTNQPSRVLLRAWREALGVDAARHPDLFDQYGNLYGAGIPLTVEHAIRAGTLRDGDLLVMAAYAHAGDFAAAAALHWRAARVS